MVDEEPTGPHLTIGTLLLGALLLIYVVWLRLATRFPYVVGDIELTRWVQHAVGGLHGVFGVLSWPGGPGAAVLTLVVTLALWAAGYGREGWTVMLGSLAGYLITLGSQAVAKQPRPSGQVVRVYEGHSIAGFPSGHAVLFAVVFGYLGYLAWREGRRRGDLRWDFAMIACGLLILGLAVARVALGSHWPSQVLAGLYLGGLILGVMIWTTRAAEGRPLTRRRPG